MGWNLLEDENQLQVLIEKSYSKPQAIFKHSTRCIISTLAKSRVEKFSENFIDVYYLDLIAYRNLSNSIADKFSIHHQSPQILIIKNGECIFDESHGGINIDDFLQFKN